MFIGAIGCGKTSFIQKLNELQMKQIKIFAMSKDEPRFKNKAYAYVQREFFLKDLVNEKGKFLYYRNGMNISGDTLVLFN